VATMSVRRRQSTKELHTAKLRQELETLRQNAISNTAANSVAVAAAADSTSSATDAEAAPENIFAEKSHVEKRIEALKAPKEDWRPLTFLNEGHFEALTKANALSTELTKNIAAYKAQSESTTEKAKK